VEEKTKRRMKKDADLSTKKSEELYKRASKVLVGGVNSPVRAFKGVGGKYPLYISRGKGSKIWDVDGNEYIDYVCSWGPLILGHAHPSVVKAVSEALEEGTSYGASTERETRLGEMIVEAIPSVEMVRFVNSGTEAAMSAVRLARGYTNRSKVVMFEGCYHGHVDQFLVEAGSGLATFGLPNSAGIPSSIIKDTILCPYNDIDGVKKIFGEFGSDIACVIVEPIAGNMGVVLPNEGFLSGLREVTERYGALLIFDEVITGFRLRYGGVQDEFGVSPDLTILGKVIGGGFPVAAYGGRKDIMSLVSPLGPVYQAGTLSGNPVAMSAGIATLDELNRGGKRSAYEKLDNLSRRLEEGITKRSSENGVDLHINRAGSMLGIFFQSGDVNIKDYATVKRSNTKLYSNFFWSMLAEGVYLPPSPFETNFVSLAHSYEDIDKTIEASEKAFELVSSIVSEA
jgi:glutamate-1-semialdehyde 2,1-aminomutase